MFGGDTDGWMGVNESFTIQNIPKRPKTSQSNISMSSINLKREREKDIVDSEISRSYLQFSGKGFEIIFK